MKHHQDIDQRSLDLHRLVVKKIQSQPVLFERIPQTLAHWREVVAEQSQPYVLAWQQLAEQGMDACLAAAVDETEWGHAMRQCSPFTGILSHKERFTFLREWEREHQT